MVNISVNNAQRGFAFDNNGIIDNSLFLRFYTEEEIGEGCQAVILTNTNPKYIVKSIGEEFKEEAESAAAANYSYRYTVNLKTSDFGSSPNFLNQYFVFRIAIVDATVNFSDSTSSQIDAWFNSANDSLKSNWSDPIYKNAVFDPKFTILTDSFDPYQEQQIIEAQMTFGVGETDRLKHCKAMVDNIPINSSDIKITSEGRVFIQSSIINQDIFSLEEDISLSAIWPNSAGSWITIYNTSFIKAYYQFNNNPKTEFTSAFGINANIAIYSDNVWDVQFSGTPAFTTPGKYAFWMEDDKGNRYYEGVIVILLENPLLKIYYETEKGYINIAESNIEILRRINAQISMISNIEIVEGEYKNTLTFTINHFTESNKQVKVLRYIDDKYEFIKTYNIDTTSPINYTIDDSTIEAGIPYQYKVVYLYTLDNEDYQDIQEIGNEVISLFEDIYLIDEEDEPFSVKYNPEVSSLKYNIGESITNTLGSQYPVYRRNEQNYRTFTIGGLISYHGDEERFTDGDVVTDSVVRNTTPNPDYRPRERNYTNNKYDALDNYHKEALRERDYRNKIINFLHKNNLKLFKSLQEGNMIVKLSNISLTSNQQLGRNIYSFSATATEMDEATIANLSKHRIHLVPMWIDGDRVYKEYYLQGTLDAAGNLIVDSEELTIQEQQTILEGASNV